MRILILLVSALVLIGCRDDDPEMEMKLEELKIELLGRSETELVSWFEEQDFRYKQQAYDELAETRILEAQGFENIDFEKRYSALAKRESYSKNGYVGYARIYAYLNAEGKVVKVDASIETVGM